MAILRYKTLELNGVDYSDEYCPFCDNHFVLDAITPKPALKVEGPEARVDPRMLKDDRLPTGKQQSVFDVQNASDRLG